MAFQVGEVVQLKSGGPKMTVEQVTKDGKLWCLWFEGTRKVESGFLPATVKSLNTAEDDDDGPTSDAVREMFDNAEPQP